jgi:hypothetical protein
MHEYRIPPRATPISASARATDHANGKPRRREQRPTSWPRPLGDSIRRLLHCTSPQNSRSARSSGGGGEFVRRCKGRRISASCKGNEPGERGPFFSSQFIMTGSELSPGARQRPSVGIAVAGRQPPQNPLLKKYTVWEPILLRAVGFVGIKFNSNNYNLYKTN